MARRRSQLKAGILAALSCVVAASVLAQEAPPAAPPTPATPAKKKEGPRKLIPPGSPSPELENVRKALEALSPEQRKQFRENLDRWMNLPPDEKKALTALQETRRKHMADELAEAISESGLQLDGPRRQQYVKRYAEERRKIEEELRKEADEKRGPKVEELRARLKAEFSAPATAAPAPAVR